MKKAIIFHIAIWAFALHSFAQKEAVKIYDIKGKKRIVFTANNNTFCLLGNEANDSVYTLAKFGRKWEVIDNNIASYNKFYIKDVNRDGFDDVVLEKKWRKEVYFYHPAKKTFIHTGTFSYLGFDMIIIDNEQEVYYDYQPLLHERWSSFLFKIKKYKRINLAEIKVESEYSEADGGFIPKLITINKIINKRKKAPESKQITTIEPIKNKDFNYTVYWKLNWERFLK